MHVLPHLPVLDDGRTFESMVKSPVRRLRDGVTVARVSQLDAAGIRERLARNTRGSLALARIRTEVLLQGCAKAADSFLYGSLPLGDRGHVQDPAAFVRVLSETGGLPHHMVRSHMVRLAECLREMPSMLAGLTRGVAPEMLDSSSGWQGNVPVDFQRVSARFGILLPGNSPAVNAVWLPAIPLKTSVIIRPGPEEPWTSWRLIQALIASGLPTDAFSYLPTDYEGAQAIARGAGRCVAFGDAGLAEQHRGDPAVMVQHSGPSKIVLDDETAARWPEFLDTMIESVMSLGGRACLNASTILTPRHGRDIAEALARRLGAILPLPPEDPAAALTAFARPELARAIETTVEEALKTPGAVDLCAAIRAGPRLCMLEGLTYLRPSVILCERRTHPLYNREYVYPHVCVLELPMEEILQAMGPTLSLTLISRDAGLIASMLERGDVHRMAIGPVPTTRISCTQSVEGNLFEFLFRRRAVERAVWTESRDK